MSFSGEMLNDIKIFTLFCILFVYNVLPPHNRYMVCTSMSLWTRRIGLLCVSMIEIVSKFNLLSFSIYLTLPNVIVYACLCLRFLPLTLYTPSFTFLSLCLSFSFLFCLHTLCKAFLFLHSTCVCVFFFICDTSLHVKVVNMLRVQC